jgi:guanine nucleotide-binding protein G(i) subunit alpha
VVFALQITKPDFVPTVEDCQRARVRTTGIVENRFRIEDSEIKVFDVGGMPNERKKWIHT